MSCQSSSFAPQRHLLSLYVQIAVHHGDMNSAADIADVSTSLENGELVESAVQQDAPSSAANVRGPPSNAQNSEIPTIKVYFHPQNHLLVPFHLLWG